MSLPRLLVAAAVVLLTACTAPVGPTYGPAPATSVPTLAGSSASVPPPPRTPRTTGAGPDYDGDGLADLAYGLGYQGARDLVVRYGSGRAAGFTTVDLLGSRGGNATDAMLARDVTGDGYTDLLVVASPADPRARETQLRFLYGSPTGLHLDPLRAVTMPVGYDVYRVTSLVAVELPVPRLAVGFFRAHGRGPGKVLLYDLGAGGLPFEAPTILEPGLGLVPGLEDEGTFGFTLASAGDRLFVGVPEATVGQARGAGAVVDLTLGPSGASTARLLTQATPGVAGAPGPDTAFGTALDARDGSLVVGAPGDSDGAAGAGTVHRFELRSGGLDAVGLLSQDAPAMPDDGEAGDGFGSTVALAAVCPGVEGVVIGGPGERVGDASDEGAVWVVPSLPTGACPVRRLAEGRGLAGTPVTGRALGSGLAVVHNAGESADVLVVYAVANGGEGHDGVLYTWSGQTGRQVLKLGIGPSGVVSR